MKDNEKVVRSVMLTAKESKPQEDIFTVGSEIKTLARMCEKQYHTL